MKIRFIDRAAEYVRSFSLSLILRKIFFKKGDKIADFYHRCGYVKK